MKKKIKAFTLIELIIVMAILAILMSALMNFYKPIRETYVDSSMIENMRSTQDGVLEYLTESVRYAEYMMLFDEGATYGYEYEYTDPADNTKKLKKTGNLLVDSAEDAYKAFCIRNSFIEDNNQARPDETKYENTLKNVHIIVLNRADGYNINGLHTGAASTGYSGRIITNIIDDTRITAKSFGDAYGDRTASATATGDSYMALGGAYYGESNYAIFIDKDESWDTSGSEAKYKGNLTFKVQNALTNDGGIIKNVNDYGNSVVQVDNNGKVTLTSQKSALTKNLSELDYYTGNSKKIGDSGAPEPAGSVAKTGNVTKGTTNTYIVYVEPDETTR